jgi:hypothetical protein
LEQKLTMEENETYQKSVSDRESYQASLTLLIVDKKATRKHFSGVNRVELGLREAWSRRDKR